MEEKKRKQVLLYLFLGATCLMFTIFVARLEESELTFFKIASIGAFSILISFTSTYGILWFAKRVSGRSSES